RLWIVQLGRRDAKTASKSDANTNLPPATLSFTTKEMVILSGKCVTNYDNKKLIFIWHSRNTRCITFRSRIHNETNIDAPFATLWKTSCPTSGNDNNLAPLDSTPTSLLHSDQELFNGGSTDAQVTTYSNDNPTFLTDFAFAMVKMGNLSPLTGTNGETRTNCRILN
ncbi:hypothetical protein MKX01_002628, partial [Papaver californicum]